MKRGILFDNDGVLVDTEVWYFRANEKAMGDLGVLLEREYYLQLMTYGGNWWQLALDQGVSVEAIHRARQRRNSYYQEYLRRESIMIPEAIDVVRSLASSYTMGIVTTSRRVDFELIHREGLITSHMDFVLCEEDYPRAKPYPDPYLHGLLELGMAPEEVIVVEDSERGLRSALSAGIECVIVDHPFTASHNFDLASYRIHSITELVVLLDQM